MSNTNKEENLVILEERHKDFCLDLTAVIIIKAAADSFPESCRFPKCFRFPNITLAGIFRLNWVKYFFFTQIYRFSVYYCKNEYFQNFKEPKHIERKMSDPHI